jgi:defect-in-organelle-trafficking protein DotB
MNNPSSSSAVESPVEEKPFFLSGAKVEGALQYDAEPVRFSRRDVEPFFVWASSTGASDITIQTGEQIFLEVDGKMHRVTKHYLDNTEVMEIVVAMYGSESAKGILSGDKDLDFPYQINPTRFEKFRYRVNCVGVQVNGTLGVQLTARTIPGMPPQLEQLNLEADLLANVCPKQGMFVVTGGTGSGKSTLLAAIIRHLLEDPNGHRKIITFESPIEYVYDDVDHPTTSISQTEIGKSLTSFAEGTRNALRRKPTIIMLGEARDAETIGEAVTASMTGHLLYTTVHSNGFPDTIRRMVNVFDGSEKNSRAVDIISSLRVVVSQRLVPATNGKRQALREYVVMNEEIVDFILEAGVDNLTASCRHVLKKWGRSFLQDATEKYNAGLISQQVWKEIARSSQAEDTDAQEVARAAKERGDLLGVQMETFAATPLEVPPGPTFQPDLDVKWPADEPPLDL